MKKKLLFGLIGVTLLSVVLFFVFANRGGSGEIMQLAKSGATETEMLTAAEKAPTERLNADQVIQLKKSGVPDNVIITMLRKNTAGTAAVTK
jgi:hypothetical protein